MKPVHYQSIITALLIIIAVLIVSRYPRSEKHGSNNIPHDSSNISQQTRLPAGEVWKVPDTADIPATPQGELIRYGRKLIVHTAEYFGPKGKIAQAENGLNCQNCHIAAGTRLFGNNFSKVACSYPKYRPRRDKYVSIAGRINGCMERSMNGKALDTNRREMKAFIAYFKWLGKGVDRKTNLFGEGTEKLPFLDRAADPEKGSVVFTTICQACHGKNGEGKLKAASTEYLYPALWGTHSYNTGAGLYRISKFADYVKNNMPFGTTCHDPLLTDEQAWDVAAFVNSKPHPAFKDIEKDWPKIASKPFDYPFGPYADKFSERQHKYGPFEEIVNFKDK
jgi:thiosulfate dehydrogenase